MKKKTAGKMKKKERIAAAVKGELTDRIPFALWLSSSGEMPGAEESAERAYAFYKACDADIVKTLNSGMYSAEDFRTGDGAGKGPSVNTGALAREQNGLKFLLDKTKGEVPVVFTVFSPFSAAEKLCPHILQDIEAGRDRDIRKTLTVITETTCELVRRVIELGADGIFLEAPLASYDRCSERVYRKYGMSYDLAVLSASGGWCNVLHGGGADVMFPLLRKYPVQIFSWDAAESLPEIGEAQALTGKCIMTGLDAHHIEGKKRNEVERDIYETLRRTGGRKLILSPGRGLSGIPDAEMISFARKSLEEIERACFPG